MNETKKSSKKKNPPKNCDGVTLQARMCPLICFEGEAGGSVSVPVALAYTTLACGSLFCRSSTALPIFVDVAFLALWHSSKIICGEGEGSRGKLRRQRRLRVRSVVFFFLLLVSNQSDKGYDSVKVRLAPVQDLFDSGPVLPSSLALPDQRRVGSKQDSF